MGDYFRVPDEDAEYSCPECGEKGFSSSESASMCCKNPEFVGYFECPECEEKHYAESDNDYRAQDQARECCLDGELDPDVWICAECLCAYDDAHYALHCCNHGEGEEIDRPEEDQYVPPKVPTIEEELTATDNAWEKELS